MSIDNVSWHNDGLPDGFPSENQATHIGLFIRWCGERNLLGSLYTEEEADAVAALRSGELSGTRFVLDFCDGKLNDLVLNEEGHAFAVEFYDEYLNTHAELLDAPLYTRAEGDLDFTQWSTLLDSLFARFQSGERLRGRPWWKFW